MNIDLSQRVAVVTGAGQGIGWAIARQLADAGASLVIADINYEAAALRVTELPGANGATHLAVAVDVGDELSVAEMVERTTTTLGGPHVLVNNAGISRPASTLDTDLDRWEEVVRVNLTGAFLCSRACLPAMREAGWGRIVNLSSFNAKSAPIHGDNASYAASKAGLTGLIHNLAVEFAPAGVTVNGIAPGIVDTDLLRSAHTPERRAELVKRIPVARFTTPEEVASLAVFLASEQARSITGEIININGGLYFD